MRAHHAYPLPRAYTAYRSKLVYAIWGALIWMVGLVPMLSTLITPRDFSAGSFEVAISSGAQGGLARWVGLAITVLSFVPVFAGLIVGITSRDAQLPRAGFFLWLGAMALALGPLLSSQLGSQPGFSPPLLGLPLMFTAVYLLPSVPLGWFVRQAKMVLLLYAYGSLFSAVVAPTFAVQNPYTEGLVPGFDIRLHGLASHANNLSVILLSYLVLSWFSPARFRWERLHQVVALSALILTQSKTVWIILMIAYLLRLAYARQRYARLALLGAALGIGAFYLALGPDWLDTAGGFWQNNQITTLTGRTRVWEITLDLWEQNPWFGYGPDLWAGEMRTAYRGLAGFAVPHAHSQFYQSLGEAGIVGVAGLFLYVMILLVYGVRYAGATAGVALILVVAMLIRGVTEPPFRTILTDGNLFVHLLTFAFLIVACRRKKERDEA